MMQAAGFVTVVAAIFHHLNRVGYEIITPMTVQQEEVAQIGPSQDHEVSLLAKGQEVSPLEQELCPIHQNLSPIFHHLNRVGYEIITPMTVQQEEVAQIGPSGDHEVSLLAKGQEVSPLEQELCPIHQNLSPIFHHLNRVGYEIIAPVTVQQEEVAQIWPSQDHEVSLLAKGQEVSPLEQELCPIHQNLSPGDHERSYIHQNDHNSRVDGIIGDVLFCFVVHFLWRQLLQRLNSRDPPQAEEDILAEGSVCTTAALLLDKGVLGGFYERYIHTRAHENWRVLEFVEGFSDDLLGALRSTLDGESGVQVEDCIGVGSMYESWRVSKPLVCDLIIPFAPPEPYRFSFQLWRGPVNGVPSGRQASGRILLDSAIENKTSCPCGMANLGEDMLCLLHGPHTMAKFNILENLLCSKGTPYLAKEQVIKWFQIAITKAWGQISHKYEFELTFRNLGSPGALKVRFRSGKTIIFNLAPVIQFEDSDAYFVSQFTSSVNDSSDTCWPLSFAVYEKRLLKYLAKRLPENSCHIRCLQIVCFLHKKQTGLTGKTSLSVYHLKSALLHLLLDKRPLDWSSDRLENRARDILEFILKSLRKKELRHALIGNSRVPKEIGIPPSFIAAEPINLFRPLAAQKRLYAEMEKHFWEMVRNAAALIQEYSPHLPAGNAPQFRSTDLNHGCHL